MVVRKVQLEFCFESKSFAPSDDILTVQRYEVFLKLPNNTKEKSTFLCFTHDF